MTEYGRYRDWIAKAFMITGGIMAAISIAALIGWGLTKLGFISSDINWAVGKLLFACSLGFCETGNILLGMVPQQSKDQRRKAIIGISMLMCCSVICIVFMITRYTTYVILPLTIGLIGDYIGSKAIKGDSETNHQITD